jgi:hypothetical protein
MKRSHSLSTKWHTAIHEAGHAVVGHLTGTAIDHVTIVPARGAVGHSKPVRGPTEIAAQKLWDEATTIRRRLVRGNLTEGFDGKRGWLLRKGSRRRHWKWNGRTVKPSKNGCGIVTIHGTPAPQLARRVTILRRRASALWKEETDSRTRKDRVQDLMHTLGGPVADCVFFDAPFEPGRWHRLPAEEISARGMDVGCYGYGVTGNTGARSDFRSIGWQLKKIDKSNWKELREYYRAKVEKLVRQNRDAIERVAKALLRRKTLSGAEVAKIINEKKQTSN